MTYMISYLVLGILNYFWMRFLGAPVFNERPSFALIGLIALWPIFFFLFVVFFILTVIEVWQQRRAIRKSNKELRKTYRG